MKYITEHILKKIDLLQSRFTDLECELYFDQLNKTYYIYVLSEALYESDEFLNMEVEITTDFFEKFPGYMLLFVSNDSINQPNGEKINIKNFLKENPLPKQES